MSDPLVIAGKSFASRLFLGTGKFASGKIMAAALEASEAEMVTVALRRVNLVKSAGDILSFVDRRRYHLLPNTSGARDAAEAILLAHLAREAGLSSWIKLEVIPDPQYLLPDPIETLKAAEALVREGFVVLPYIQADPILAKRLADIGCATVMPLAAPIGSNRGIKTREMLQIIIDQATVPVVVDAGIGLPEHAREAMELGADAVLVNTAIATATDPVATAAAFARAVELGRGNFSKRGKQSSIFAVPSSPLEGVIGK